MGAHKRGLKPQIFRENRVKILPGKTGLFGANWGLFRAYRGLFGADWDQLPRTAEPWGRAEIPPKGPFWARLAPFGPSPRLLSPRLDFPDHCGRSSSPFRSCGDVPGLFLCSLFPALCSLLAALC